MPYPSDHEKRVYREARIAAVVGLSIGAMACLYFAMSLVSAARPADRPEALPTVLKTPHGKLLEPDLGQPCVGMLTNYPDACSKG